MSELSLTNQNNILIVDDILDNLELLSRILTRRGYTVRSVDNGKSAIAIAKTGWADLILLDINMPEMDGYEVCHRLKADDATSAIPVIFLSALEQESDKVNAFKVGGVDYITKPFEIKETLARVTTHLQLRNLQKNLESLVASRTLELATALQDAQAANNVKNIFFSQITHELRTPMNAILGFVQLLQRDETLNADHYEQLRIISHSGEHLMALINDVLEVSKIESGRLILEVKNFDLARMLKGIEEMLQLKTQTQNLTFAIQRSDFIPRYIVADEQKLRQVLINLLANALKFTQQGQVTLVVNYNPQKPHLMGFEIRDTGFGIAESELDNLFIPFVQTETGRQAQSGTGLGLSICHKYVKLMGGEIKVTSQVNRGSTFSFEIPITLGEPIAERVESLRVIGLQPHQVPPKVLIAEDRWENRQFLVRLLEMVGFQVKEALDGKEAIAIWSSWSPDLVLMDLQMPVIDGYEATQHIKRLDPTAKIIAISASQFKEQEKFIMSSGCDDLMNLPFKETELWSKIADYLKVDYIYEQPTVKDHNLPPVASEELQSQITAIMPLQWVEDLHYYAIAADAKEIARLLTQLPQEHAAVAQAIAKLADDFCFEQIIALSNTTAKR